MKYSETDCGIRSKRQNESGKEDKVYHEEKVIKGKLCWRSTPDGEWVEMTPERLTQKVMTLQKQLNDNIISFETVYKKLEAIEQIVKGVQL